MASVSWGDKEFPCISLIQFFIINIVRDQKLMEIMIVPEPRIDMERASYDASYMLKDQE